MKKISKSAPEAAPFDVWSDVSFADGYREFVASVEPDFDYMADAEFAATLADLGIKAA